MVYGIKIVRYQNQERRILLQNENGPCPLLAAANALLLQGLCTLPPASVRNSVASLEDVTNMLAEHALPRHSNSKSAPTGTDQTAEFHLHELVQFLPKFQYGMDVNPKFTQGITGYEYTAELTAFDMLLSSSRCRLVHGWLVDMQDEDTFQALGTKTYNQLVELMVQASEAEQKMDFLQQKLLTLETTQQPSLDENQQKEQLQKELRDLQSKAYESLLVRHFLESTGHQLTPYGLIQLHEELRPGEISVFFRNNHFGTLTKHSTDGHLYLLVTDLGYANSPAIVWERLDVIDGDTDYVNSDFVTSSSVAPQDALATGPTLTPEQLMAASEQKEADYQLALQLSKQTAEASTNNTNTAPSRQDELDEQEGRIMAAATEASLREYHGIPNNTTTTATDNVTSAMGAATIVSLPPAVASAHPPPAVASANPQTHIDDGVPLKDPPISYDDDRKPAPVMATQGIAMSQMDADRQLALQLQQEGGGTTSVHHDDDDDDAALARRLQQQQQSSHSGQGDEALARQLQAEEDQRRQVSQQQQPPRRQPAASASSSSGGCVIS